MKLRFELDAVKATRIEMAREIVITQGMKNVTVNGEQYNPCYDVKGRVFLSRAAKEMPTKVKSLQRLRDRIKREKTYRRAGSGGPW
jgi:hypothetical protein